MLMYPRMQTLLCSKKGQGQPLVAVAEAIHLPSNVLHIYDNSAGIRYLVDTGTCVSLFPANHEQRNNIDPNPLQLSAANGQPIPTYGSIKKTLSIAGQQYSWTFKLASVTQPLIGADFFTHYRLIVDMASRVILPASAALAARTSEAGTRICGSEPSGINACTPDSNSGSAYSQL